MFGKGEEPSVWYGQIYKKDIIATDNSRDEYEIIQHGSIKNLNRIILTDEKINAAVDAVSKRRGEKSDVTN